MRSTNGTASAGRGWGEGSPGRGAVGTPGPVEVEVGKGLGRLGRQPARLQARPHLVLPPALG